MELGPELFRTTGRVSRPVTAAVLRELEGSDLVLLGAEKGSVPPVLIKRLSERHHSLAMAVAQGTSDHIQLSAIYSYSQSRISILLSDPAFKELVEFYRGDATKIAQTTAEVAAETAFMAATELRHRVEEAPEEFSIGQLQEVFKTMADRTGLGPQTSQTNINVNVDLASRLQAARQRVALRQFEEGETLEGVFSDIS